jgi:pimeloyl-ACP methyl ester carboxylesterase
MERARVNGIELEYEIIGSGEPVLLIHGSHVAGSFKPLLAQPALTDEYTLIRYHRRGHLDSSPATGPVSIEQQAADARALLEYLHAQPAHVVGHSYGGAIAMQLALDAPESVHSLALLVVGVRDDDGLVRPEAFVVLENSGGEQALEATLRQYMRQHLGGNKTPRAFHFVTSLPETASGKPRTATPHEPPSRGDAGSEDPRPGHPSGTLVW